MKFRHQREAAKVLGELIACSLPSLSVQTVTIMPSDPARIRNRGFDHTAIIGREVARLLNIDYSRLLVRRKKHHQVGQNRELRLNQAKNAYFATRSLSGKSVLLLDDVITSGATMLAGAQALVDTGHKVYAAAAAHEP